MFCAGTCDAAGTDLAAIRDVFAEKGDVFVIDIADLISAEAAWLLLEFLHGRSRHLADLRLWLQCSVISCAHYGAPFRMPCSCKNRNGWLVIVIKTVVDHRYRKRTIHHRLVLLTMGHQRWQSLASRRKNMWSHPDELSW
jgi:hypothetical protein